MKYILTIIVISYTLQGYSNRRAFIIAQTPMRNTAIDFWKMIIDYSIPGVITCSEECCDEEV